MLYPIQLKQKRNTIHTHLQGHIPTTVMTSGLCDFDVDSKTKNHFPVIDP